MLKETKTYKLGHSFDGFRMSSRLGDINYFDNLECYWMEVEMIYDGIKALYIYTIVLWLFLGIHTDSQNHYMHKE